MKLSLTFIALGGLASRSLGSALPPASNEKRGVPNKPVFAHYMVGGWSEDQVRQDIIDAQNLGLDAFALNYDTIAGWSNNTVEYMFDIAEEKEFHLFFSFDMNPTHFTEPSQYASYLQKYMVKWPYFRYSGRPLVSTFGGDHIDDSVWSDFKDTVGDVMLVPGFYQTAGDTNLFSKKPTLDGVFNWNAWPKTGEEIVVPTDDDQAFLTAAQNTDRLFMMGMSPLQFKHISRDYNWYRRGEDNLENRFGQILSMQPHMVEMMTWNDGGESHYMGNLWSNSGLTNDYDHHAYQEILKSFIGAWKRGEENTNGMVPTNGQAVQGAFWHHTLLKDSYCGNDGLGKPGGVSAVEDVVSGAILVAEQSDELDLVIKVDGNQIGYKHLDQPGMNKFKISGLHSGTVTAEIYKNGGQIAKATGPLPVVDSSNVCNYNFQVVGI